MESSHRRRILVVDDNEEFAENIAEILTTEGHSVRIAHSAEQALPMVHFRDLDVIVTDFRLPGISGAELLTKLRDRGESLRGVVISAYTDDVTVNTALRAGAKFISKPVDFALLSHVIREGSA